jgi:hypothetical protein
LVSSKLFLLFKFLLNLSHLLANTVIWAHGKTLSDELDTEHEEKSGRSEVCEAFREECGDGVAHHSREDCHDDESGEGSRENEESGVSHSHEGCNEECLVSNL